LRTKKISSQQKQLAHKLFLKGLSAQDNGLGTDAVKFYTEALQYNPEHLEALYNLAIILHDQGDYNKALTNYQKVVTLNPNLAIAHKNIGDALLALEEPDKAISSYQTAVDIDPELAEAWYNLGLVERQQLNLDRAEKAFNRALTLRPGYTAAKRGLARLLCQQGRLKNSLALYQKLIKLCPDDYDLKGEMIDILHLKGDLDTIQTLTQEILNELPEDPRALNFQGLLYQAQGRAPTAIKILQQAVKNAPELFYIHSNLLYAMLMNPDVSPTEYLDEARHWWQKAAPTTPSPGRQPHTNHKLRLGFISADLKRHSVSYFLLPLLEHIDKQKIKLYAYSDVARTDDMSALIQQQVDYWRPIRGVNDDEVFNLIKKDQIDILVELSGHTASNRLPLIARKPAPVQISWLGYPASTGISNGTFRLTDNTVDPEGSEAYYSEPLLRLQRPFLCYSPPPEVNDLTINSNKNHPVTFGSFNNPAKINRNVIAVWSRILSRTPGSKIILKSKTFISKLARNNFIKQFVNYGIDAARIELRPPTPATAAHFNSYNDIDIALDTFPYNGTTTTCEALWMGVPVITCRDPCFQCGSNAACNNQLPGAGCRQP